MEFNEKSNIAVHSTRNGNEYKGERRIDGEWRFQPAAPKSNQTAIIFPTETRGK
jgi:hypothetical protein